MPKNALTKYGLISVGFLAVVAIIFCFLYGELFGNPVRIRLNLWLHSREYNITAIDFLSQNKIKNLAFNVGSEIINNCSNHPDYNTNGQWSCTEVTYPERKAVTFKDKTDVLRHLDISEQDYQRYSGFLRKYGLDGVGKGDKGEFVELTDRLQGLRYYEKANVDSFVKNDEYLYIKQVDNHWFTFERDWN